MAWINKQQRAEQPFGPTARRERSQMAIAQAKAKYCGPLLVGAMLTLGLLGCAPKEEILQGERLDPRTEVVGLNSQAPASLPVDAPKLALPRPVRNADWRQQGGSASHDTPHLDLAAAPQLRWSVPIGLGNGRQQRLSATPVVAGGNIFTLDAAARVTALGLDGQQIWSRNLTPRQEGAVLASGGGLAVEGDTLFVTTGFGQLVALNRLNGDVTWVQDFDAPVMAAPTVAAGRVFVMSEDASGWALDARDGRVLWRIAATSARGGVLGAAAPTLSDRLAIFAFSSGDVRAVLQDSGYPIWGEIVAGRRLGRAYNAFFGIPAAPVLHQDRLYLANQSGQSVALERATGDRVWDLPEGGYGQFVAVSGALFNLTDAGQLIRLNAATGARVWAVDLPQFAAAKVKKRKRVYAHFGPILAGGRLIVVSDDGLMRAFDPQTGALISADPLPQGAAVAPIVADGTLYIITVDGKLHAFR